MACVFEPPRFFGMLFVQKGTHRAPSDVYDHFHADRRRKQTVSSSHDKTKVPTVAGGGKAACSSMRPRIGVTKEVEVGKYYGTTVYIVLVMISAPEPIRGQQTSPYIKNEYCRRSSDDGTEFQWPEAVSNHQSEHSAGRNGRVIPLRLLTHSFQQLPRPTVRYLMSARVHRNTWA